MRDAFRDVYAFHEKFGAVIGTTPAEPDLGTVLLRLKLLREEFDELVASMGGGDLPGIADACADLIYVTIGTAISYGIDLPAVWDAVQESNLRKCGEKREDGKVMKDPNFVHPDIAGTLANQRSIRELAATGRGAGGFGSSGR